MDNIAGGLYGIRESCMDYMRDREKKYKIILQVMIAGISLLTCLVHQLSVGIGVLFFMFQFFCVYMQGLLILEGLRINLPDEISKTAYRYGIGLTMLVPEYYLFQLLRIGKFSWVLPLAIGIGGCIYLYLKDERIVKSNRSKETKTKPDLDENRTFGWIVCLSFLFLVYVVDFLTVSLVNTLPSENGGTGYYVDWLFWVGNAISFLKGLPVQNFRLVGIDFRYHFFSSIVIAQISQMTGIDVTIIAFYFSFIIVSVIMVLIAYVLFRLFTENKVMLALSMLLMFFTGDKGVTSQWHYYFCPFGYDYGLAVGMLSICYLFLKRSEEWKGRDIIISSVLIAATTGFKAPIAVIILVGFGMEGVWLLTHSKLKTAFMAGASWLAAFVATYYVFIANRSRELTKTYYGIQKAFENNLYGMEVYNNILSVIPLPSRVGKVIAFLISTITANRAILVFLGIAAVIYIFRKKLIRYELAMLLLMVITGVYLTSAFLMGGGSQMYFIMAVLPYAICFSIPAVEDFFKTEDFLKKTVVITVLCYSFAFGIRHWENNFEKLAWQGINAVEGNLTYENYQEDYSYTYAGSFYLSKDFLEVYDWIRDNTEDDCIIAAQGARGDLVSGVFTQRFIWNDGTYCDAWIDEVDRRNEIISMLDDPLTFDKGVEELKSGGVSYYVEEIQATGVSIAEQKLKKLYSNNIMAVYKVE